MNWSACCVNNWASEAERMRAMWAHKKIKIGLAVVFASAWVAALVLGQRVLLNYDYAAGAEATAPAKWPNSSKISRRAGAPVIVVVAHPRCPCTRATIEELAVLMAHVRERATAAVVFVRPDGLPEDWEKTDLWRSAERIPGVSVWSDPSGVEASLLGAQASGQTLVYDAAGMLRFSGGITAFRGHSGDNAGRSAIESLVRTGSAFTSHTSVYGCSLHNPERAVDK
jgi:hypothetical protein